MPKSKNTSEQVELQQKFNMVSLGKRQWEKIADNLEELVLLVAMDGTVQRANRTIEQWGISSVLDTRNLHVSKILPQDCLRQLDNDKLSATWKHATNLDAGSPCIWEGFSYQYQRHLRIRIQKIDDVEGIFFVVVLADVSERVELETKALRQAEELLRRRKLESVGRLTGGIAHDLNNILTAIGGFTMFAKDSIDEDHPAAADLQEIELATAKATALTSQLLAFGGKNLLQTQSIELEAFVVAHWNEIQNVGGQKVILEPTGEEISGCVSADPTLLRDIILLLVKNANEATAEKGTIKIAIDIGEEAKILISDDGCGMSQETTTRMFDPFFSTKNSKTGVGMGLAVVYGAVKQMKGNIVVDSELDRGTILTISLPVASPDNSLNAVSAQAESDQIASSSEDSKTILLVDDNRAVREMAARTLRGVGYLVLVADCGEAALRLWSENNISLLVSDIVMPGMSGFELVAQLRIQQPNLQTIFISAYAEVEGAEAWLAEENCVYLNKPFSQEDLTALVNSRIELSA